MDWDVSLVNSYVEILTPCTSERDLFGNRNTAHRTIMLGAIYMHIAISRRGLLTPVWSTPLYGGEIWPQRHALRMTTVWPHGGEPRACKPRNAEGGHHLPEAQRETRSRFCLTVLEGANLDLGLLASEVWAEKCLSKPPGLWLLVTAALAN